MTEKTRIRVRRRGYATGSGLVVGPVFLGLAVWFLWGPDLVEFSRGVPEVVDAERISTTPRRRVPTGRPVIVVDGVERTCMDCHRLFAPGEKAPAEPQMHRHVVLKHGLNDQCRNCHALQDRSALGLHDGVVIPFDQSPQLCGKCHGPTFRDWQRGVHGRTDGYWDASRGEVKRLLCTQCHDPHSPHSPAMDPMEPLPRPRPLKPLADDDAHHDEERH